MRTTMPTIVLALLMAAAPVRAGTPGDAPDGWRAPALRGSDWLNTRPLRAEDFAGKVRVVEFWTFDCINCRRTVPAMKRLDARFRAGGDVVIVGIHTPELPHERDRRNVQRAIEALGLPYPVLLDNGMANWNAFHNQYWPALYVIDRHGIVRGQHIGELHEGTPGWDETVALIESLRRERS